jgi:hypothetical protein
MGLGTVLSEHRRHAGPQLISCTSDFARSASTRDNPPPALTERRRASLERTAGRLYGTVWYVFRERRPLRVASPLKSLIKRDVKKLPGAHSHPPVCTTQDFGCVRLLQYEAPEDAPPPDMPPNMPPSDSGMRQSGCIPSPGTQSSRPDDSGSGGGSDSSEPEATVGTTVGLPGNLKAAGLLASGAGDGGGGGRTLAGGVDGGGGLVFDGSDFVGTVQYMAPELLRRGM